MPITFEEVTGEIQPPERASTLEAPPTAQDSAPDALQDNLERALRLMAERSARVFAD
jgi:hypothetical protein